MQLENRSVVLSFDLPAPHPQQSFWLYRLIFDSHLFLAVCAAAMCWETSVLLGTPVRPVAFYLFVFCATLVIYNLHAIVRRHGDDAMHAVVGGVGAVGLLVTAPSILSISVGWVGVMAGLAVAYSFPIFPGRRRIREFGPAKIVTLVLVWTAVTAWLPIMNEPVAWLPWGLVALRRLLYIFVIGMMFDIRDEREDAAAGIRTLAVRLGREGSYRLVAVILLIHVGLTILATWCPHPVSLRIAGTLLLSAVLAMILVAATKLVREHRLCLTCIDGLMAMQALLVWIAARGVVR